MKKILCFILTALCLFFSINTTVEAKHSSGQEIIEVFYTITYNNYKVTYSVQINQSDADSVTLLDYNSCFPDSPLPENCQFLGWTTIENSTDVEYKALDTISLSSDLKLYAVFKQNDNISGEIDDGTGSFHINVSNYTIDLTNTNKILNNIFIIIVFTIIYCYFLNPLIKILSMKGDK